MVGLLLGTAPHLLLCLICKLNFIIGIVYMRENVMYQYQWLGTLRDFRHLLGVLECVPTGSREATVQSLLLKNLLFYSLERQSCTEINLPLADSLCKSQWPELGQSNTGSLYLCPRSLMWVQRPKDLGRLPLPSHTHEQGVG